MITYRTSAKFDSQASVILISKDQVKSKKFNFSNKSLKDQISVLNQSNQFAGEDGQLFPVMIKKQVNLLVGIGAKKDMSLTALRISVRKALLSPTLSRVKDIEVIVHDKDDAVVKAVIESILIGTYAWKKYVTKDKGDKSVEHSSKKYTLVAAGKSDFKDSEAIFFMFLSNFGLKPVVDALHTLASRSISSSSALLIEAMLSRVPYVVYFVILDTMSPNGAESDKLFEITAQVPSRNALEESARQYFRNIIVR